MKKVFINVVSNIMLISASFGASVAYSADNPSDTLTFMVRDTSTPKAISAPANTSDKFYAGYADTISNETPKKIPISEIKSNVTKITTNLCSVNKGGSYEVWLSGNMSGGVVVSATAEAGIKAIINCP